MSLFLNKINIKFLCFFFYYFFLTKTTINQQKNKFMVKNKLQSF